MSAKSRAARSHRCSGRIAFHSAELHVCPGCHQRIQVTPCPACLARAFILGRVSCQPGREEEEAEPLGLELEPEHAERAADLRSGRVVVSPRTAEKLQLETA